MRRIKIRFKKIKIVLILYLLVGFLFTILRANTHYSFFVVKEDFFESNGKSYWENRCIDSNKINPFPNAQWCVDGFGEFKTEKPNRLEWYFHMYSKRPSDWIFVFLGWVLHFLGADVINFKSVGNVQP